MRRLLCFLGIHSLEYKYTDNYYKYIGVIIHIRKCKHCSITKQTRVDLWKYKYGKWNSN